MTESKKAQFVKPKFKGAKVRLSSLLFSPPSFTAANATINEIIYFSEKRGARFVKNIISEPRSLTVIVNKFGDVLACGILVVLHNKNKKRTLSFLGKEPNNQQLTDAELANAGVCVPIAIAKLPLSDSVILFGKTKEGANIFAKITFNQNAQFNIVAVSRKMWFDASRTRKFAQARIRKLYTNPQARNEFAF